MKIDRDSEQRNKIKISSKWKPTKLSDLTFEWTRTDKLSSENPVTTLGKRTVLCGFGAAEI